MQPHELINEPSDLLMISIGFIVAGVVLFVVANLIMKMIGMDINKYARESERYRNYGFAEQFITFVSDGRNIPVVFMFFGLFQMFCGIVSLVIAGGWFLFRTFAG
jgi:hypothetical protein